MERIDDWEQRKFFDNIENVIDFRGRTPKKLGMDWSDNGYLALSALNVKNGYIDPAADAHYGDKILYKKWMSGRKLKKGQVLFTTEAPMGNVAQVPDNKGYILSQRTIAFQVNSEKMIDNFLAVLLRSPNVFNELSALSSGGTAKGVSQKSLTGLNVIVPSNINEQNKIGTFFNLLDNTIALHQEKLLALRKIKTAFLEKIFNQEIRFSDFRGSWEQQKLSDIADRVKSYSLSRDVETADNTGYKYIHYGDIHTKVAGIIDENSELPNIKAGDYELLQENDVVVTDASEDYQGIATPAVVAYTPAFNLVAGLHTIAFRPKETPAIYLYYLLNSQIFKRYGCKAGTGMKVFGISSTNLMKFETRYPSLEEQKKIADFFKHFDDTIALHRQKIDSLHKLKHAYLQKMFV